MSLQRKFALLLALLSLTVLANMGVAIWALDFMRREFTTPWASIQEVQEGLNTLKHAARAQAAQIASSSALDQAEFEQGARDVADAQAKLQALDTLRLRVG